MNNKIELNMVGGGFDHDVCSSAHNINKHVEWKKDRSANISIHIDHSIPQDVDKSKLNFAWLAESSEIIPTMIQYTKDNIKLMEDKYELIFTHDKRMLPLSDKMRFIIPNACPWVKDRRIHDKSKLVSMIMSSKQMCDGHRYRFYWLSKLSGKLDHYGRGFREIANKEQGLNDYMFSVAMENSNYQSIFCEKITDCFATGTIPIFWGTPDIGEFFNEQGIIMLTEDFDISTLSRDLYQEKLVFIKENYEIAINLPSAEDYMYLHYLKNY